VAPSLRRLRALMLLFGHTAGHSGNISAIDADVAQLVIRMARKLQEYGPVAPVLPKDSPEQKHFHEWLHRVISIVNECLGVRDVSRSTIKVSRTTFHPTLVDRPLLLVLRKQTFV
jgi:hypothetical protein